MKKITFVLLTLSTLLFAPLFVLAQTPPKSILVDGTDVLFDPQYFDGGGMKVEATFYFSTPSLPQLTAEANDGQTVLVTQPANATKGKGQVVVCDDKGNPLTTYTLNFVRALTSNLLSKCQVNGSDFSFVNPDKQFVQNYPALPAGTVVMPVVNNFKDEADNDMSSDVEVIAQTAFVDGGQVLLKVKSTGVIYTLNFSVLEGTSAVPSAIDVTLVGGATFTLDPNNSTTFAALPLNRFRCDNALLFTNPIKQVSVTKAYDTQVVTYQYQSKDSVAIRVTAENGDTAIYCLVYGSTLNHNLNVKIGVPDTKVKGINIVDFSPSNRMATLTIKDGVFEFPEAYTAEPANILSERQTVFISSRPDLNKSIIYVKAESGDTISYTIKYDFDNRYDVHLDGIKIDGVAIDPFDPEVTDYSGLTAGTVTYTKRSQFSNVTILQSEKGAELIVTAEDGSATNSYFLHFTAGSALPLVKDVFYDYDNDPTPLASHIPAWTYTYPGLASLAPITADIDGEKYFVLQQGHESLPNVQVIAYSAENYAPNAIDIVANKPLSSDAELKGLAYYDGTNWVDITSSIVDLPALISVPLDNFKSEVAPLSVVADRYATVTINYAKSSVEHTTISVAAEDGTVKNYEIEYTITNPKSSNANLKSISINGVALDAAMMALNPIDIAFVPKTIPTVAWERDDDAQLVSVDHQDVNGVKLTVTAEDGTKKIYNLRFTPTSGDAQNVLKAMSINGTPIDGSQLTSAFTSAEVRDGRTISGYTSSIASDLAISVMRPDDYEIQPIMITNYRGLKDYLGNFQTSIVDLGNGGDKAEKHRYNIPITSGTTVSVDDQFSTDVKIFIDGYNGSDPFGPLGTFDDVIDYGAELYTGSLYKTFRVNYDYVGRWPLIEVQTTTDGQQVRINALTNDQGRRVYQVQVFSKKNVQDSYSIFGEVTDPDITYQFTFLPVGSDASTDLASIKVNGLELIGTSDANGKLFDQTAGENYEFVVDPAVAPFITFEKQATAKGQKVEYTVTQDPLNPWKYNAHFKITPANLSTAKEYDIVFYQYACEDGKLSALSVEKKAFDKDDSTYDTEEKDKDLLWPQLSFERTAPFDAVVQTLTANTADFSISCSGGVPYIYNIAYKSTNTELGAILVDGAPIDLSLPQPFETPASPKAAIEVRIAEEGQTLSVAKTTNKDEYTITVTAQNGATKDYVIVFTKGTSDEKNLIDLATDYGFGGGVVFDPEQFNDPYLAYSHKHVLVAQPQWIAPMVGDMYAEYYDGQTVDFTYNYNGGSLPADQEFKVTAEDLSSNAKPYVIRVMNSRSEYKQLAGIAIDGVAVPSFDPSIYDYTSLIAPIEIVGIPKITWSTLDAYQIVEAEGDGSEFGIDLVNNIIKIKVTAGYYAADNFVTYIIPISHSDADSNTELDDLLFNGLTPLSHDVNVIGNQYPDIQPIIKQGQTAIVNVNAASAQVTVIAKDGTVDAERYGVYNLIQDAGALADQVIIDGTTFTGLVDGTLQYSGITLAQSIQPEIIVLPKNKWQTVGDVEFEAATNTFTFTVTAADGVTTNTYHLAFNFSALENEKELEHLEIDGIGDIIAGPFPYNVYGCNDKPVLDMVATLKTQYQNLVWSKDKDEADNADIYSQMTATVYAGNGASQPYTITFWKDNSANLGDIKLVREGNSEVALNGDPVHYIPTPAVFDPATLTYDVLFPSHADFIPSVHFIPQSECQTATELPDKDPASTDDLVIYRTTVEAANGLTQDYVVNLKRNDCDIATLNSVSLRFNGTDYVLSQSPTVVDYEGFNGEFTLGTKSYTIRFENYIDEMPSVVGESTPTRAGDISWIFTCDRGHETATVLADADNNNLRARYTIRTQAENGSFDEYVVILENATYDENEIGMISIGPKDCSDSELQLLSPSHTLYIVDKAFSGTKYSYEVILHEKNHLEDPTVSAHWPRVVWSNPAHSTVAEKWDELTDELGYRRATCTVTLTPQKYALNPTLYPKVDYVIMFKDPYCDFNGLQWIKMQNPSNASDIVNVSTVASNYQSDKDFVVSNQFATSDPQEYHITMPKGWTESQLPIVTYDSVCSREIISADWISKTDNGATYEIQSKSEHGTVAYFRLIFTYDKYDDTNLCMAYFDAENKKMTDYAGFSAIDAHTFEVVLDKCEDFPTTMTLDLLECGNNYATATQSGPTISLDGLKCEFTATVTAQNTTKSQNYKVTFIKTLTTTADAQLAGLYLNGAEYNAYVGVKSVSPAVFDPAVASYNIVLNNDAVFPTIVAGKSLEGNQVDGVENALESSDRKKVYSITSTSCDNNASQVYTVTISRYYNNETTLEATKLYVNGQDFDLLQTDARISVTGDLNKKFSLLVKNYTITYGPKYIYDNYFDLGLNAYNLVYPTLTLQPLAEGAVLDVTDDSNEPRRYTLDVTAQNEIASSQYIADITMDPAIDCNLNIYANSALLSAPYVINLGAHDPEPVITTDYEGGADEPRYRKVTTSTNDNVTTFNVESQRHQIYGSGPQATYEVVFNRALCDDHTIKHLLFNGADMIDGGLFTGSDPDWKAEVTLSAPICGNVSDIKDQVLALFSGLELGCAEHAAYTQTATDPTFPSTLPLTHGKVTVAYTITAEDNSVATYTIDVKFDYANVAYTGLNIKKGTSEGIAITNTADLINEFGVENVTEVVPNLQYRVDLPVGSLSDLILYNVEPAISGCYEIVDQAQEIGDDGFAYTISGVVKHQYLNIEVAAYEVVFVVKRSDETRAADLLIDGVSYNLHVGQSFVESADPSSFDLSTNALLPANNNYEITYVPNHAVDHTASLKLMDDVSLQSGSPIITGSVAAGEVQYVWNTISQTGKTNTYKLTLKYSEYVPSSDASLASICIDGTAVSVLGQTNIVYVLDEHKPLAGLTCAVPVDANATATFGAPTDTEWTRSYVITVAAEDGTTQDYPLTIQRTKCEKYFLSDIKVFGSSLPSFVKDQQATYTISRSRDLSFPPTLADVTYTQECSISNQVVDVQINTIGTQSIITITSASHDNPSLTITYTVIVNQELNGVVSAVVIYENGQVVSGFNMNNDGPYYNYIDQDDFNGWPVVTTLVEPSDYAQADAPKVISQTATQREVQVTVWSDKITHDIFRTYTIVDVIRPCEKFYLSDIRLKGTNSTYDYANGGASLKDLGFFTDKTESNIPTVTLPKGAILPTANDVLSSLVLECAAHFNASVTITTMNQMMAVYKITIANSDNSLVNDYALTIALTPNPADYELVNILVNNVPITGNISAEYPLTISPSYPSFQFVGTQYKYYIILDEHSTQGYPTVEGVVNSSMAQAVCDGGVSSDNDSTRTYTIHVEDLDGNVRSADYVLVIVHSQCSENRLSNITLNGLDVNVINGFDRNFDPDDSNSEYFITLPANQNYTVPQAMLYCSQGHERVVMTTFMYATYCDYVFTTTAQNGSSRTYTVREFVQNLNDALLPAITIGPDPVHQSELSTANTTYQSNNDYRPELTNYSVVVAPHTPYVLQIDPHDYQLVEQKPVQVVKSVVTGNDSIYIHQYEVTAKDGVTTQTYTVNVYVSCSYYLLKELTVGGVSVMAGFAELTANNYVQYINLPQNGTIPTLADIQAFGLCDYNPSHQAISITQLVNNPFEAVFVISTRSETGMTATYTLYYTLEKSANANLSMISVLGADLTCTQAGCSVQVDYSFNKLLTYYVVTVDYGVNVTKADITAQLEDPTATYVVVGAGKNFQIVVTAQDGKTIKTYNVTIVSRPSNEASVEDIIVNYESLRSLGFDPATMSAYTYHVENKSDIWIMHPDSLNIDYVVTNSSMVGEEILPRVKQNDTTFTAVVRVTAQDGVTYKNYVITIINTINLSGNALLSDLKVNGVTVDGFSPAVLYYEYEVECGKAVPFVQPQGAEPLVQTITKIDADTVVGQTLVTVVAQDGVSTNTYIIQFTSSCTNEPGHNALLSDISFSDQAVLQGAFDPEVFVYYAVYPQNTSAATVPDQALFITQDPKATAYVSDQAQNALDTTIIHVVAEDGVTTNDYMIIYIIEGYGNPLLCDLGFFGDGTVAKFDEGTIEGFESEIQDYTITLDNASVEYLMDESKVQVSAVPCAATAVVESITRTALSATSILVTVNVADYGEQMTYTVTVNIATSDNGNLDNIIINGDTLNNTDCDALFRIDHEFNSTDTQYRIAVDASLNLSDINSWNFEYVFGNAQQHILAENNLTLSATEVLRIITVQAGDNSIVEYQLTFVKKNGSTLLNSLLYDGKQVINWDPEVAEFEVYCAYGQRTAIDLSKVTYLTENEFQTVEIELLDDTTVVLTVTADNCSQGQYILRMVELSQYSALLSDLTVDGRSIVDFQPLAFYYDYFRYEGENLVPDSIVGVPFDSLAIIEYSSVTVSDGVYYTITVTDRAGLATNEYVIFFQPVPYDVNSRAEVWDVGVVHLGGDIYKLASHKRNVTFALFDERGSLVQHVSVKLIDPNQSVDDPTSDGTEIQIPADRVWVYTFFWNGKERVERGKLMHLSK